MEAVTAMLPGSMVDSFGRRIDYVRISVTDRCNLRCRYCMAEHMQFLPKRDILTLEEIVELGDIFISRGVRRIRLTGGEPLVRRGVGELFRKLGGRIGNGLEEVTLTTNGVLLGQFAALLATPAFAGLTSASTAVAPTASLTSRAEANWAACWEA